jgi:hypothetical protein
MFHDAASQCDERLAALLNTKPLLCLGWVFARDSFISFCYAVKGKGSSLLLRALV